MQWLKSLFGLPLIYLLAGCSTTANSSKNISSSYGSSSPDVYAVLFINSADESSLSLERKLSTVIAKLTTNPVEIVHINTSTAAKWEKGAHEAFDRDIVPVFSKWVGLPGFAAIVDAKSKLVMGCVYDVHSEIELFQALEKFGAESHGDGYLSSASFNGTNYSSLFHEIEFTAKTTRCPPAHNVDPSLGHLKYKL